MYWIARKLDSLFGAAFAAVFGLATSQFLAFVQQYRQRLGGHFDEMQRTVEQVVSGAAFPNLASDARQQVAQDLTIRAGELQQADAAIRDATPLTRPWAFIQNVDLDIAMATLHDFQPALPLDLVSAVYGASGLLIGWLVWEIVRMPIVLLFTPSRG
jgi:hypothetical protein